MRLHEFVATRCGNGNHVNVSGNIGKAVIDGFSIQINTSSHIPGTIEVIIEKNSRYISRAVSRESMCDAAVNVIDLVVGYMLDEWNSKLSPKE